ncbi:MAG: hypothetical protein ACLS9F_10585 [Clostridium paraputrificum]
MAVKKIKEQTGAELIRYMELKDRFNSVNNFIQDISVITNPSTKRAERDLILATIVLDSLKSVQDIVDEDINITAEDIDIMDLFGDKNKEISRHIYQNFISPYVMLKKDYERLNKAKELDSKISEVERRKRIQEIKNEIKVANKYIEMFGKGNSNIKSSYELKILNLEKECRAIEETLNYKSYEQI